jgi:pyroglutamyl-peptidase
LENPVNNPTSTTGANERSRRILLTGFGPFPGAPFNPSGPLVQRLALLRRPAFTDVLLIPHIFETSYRAVDRDLPRLIATHCPHAILMFGLATRSNHARIETRACNTMSWFPDAAGRVARATAISSNRRSYLPIRAPHRALLRAARSGRIPASLSPNAGRYLCNYVYWRALEAAMRTDGPEQVAFIHIPNICRKPVRKGQKCKRFSQQDLAQTAAAILLAMVASAKRRYRTC